MKDEGYVADTDGINIVYPTLVGGLRHEPPLHNNREGTLPDFKELCLPYVILVESDVNHSFRYTTFHDFYMFRVSELSRSSRKHNYRSGGERLCLSCFFAGGCLPVAQPASGFGLGWVLAVG